jgi:hypothetical protein
MTESVNVIDGSGACVCVSTYTYTPIFDEESGKIFYGPSVIKEE